MKEINKFYKSLVQEVVTRQIANEEGDNQEQTFGVSKEYIKGHYSAKSKYNIDCHLEVVLERELV